MTSHAFRFAGSSRERRRAALPWIASSGIHSSDVTPSRCPETRTAIIVPEGRPDNARDEPSGRNFSSAGFPPSCGRCAQQLLPIAACVLQNLNDHGGHDKDFRNGIFLRPCQIRYSARHTPRRALGPNPHGPPSFHLPVAAASRRGTVSQGAGIEDVRLHDLRHTMASHAVMKRGAGAGGLPVCSATPTCK